MSSLLCGNKTKKVMRIKEPKRPVDLDVEYDNSLITVSTFDYEQNHPTFELKNENDIWISVAGDSFLLTTNQGEPYVFRQLPTYGNPVSREPLWIVNPPHWCEEYNEIKRLKERIEVLNDIIINKYVK